MVGALRNSTISLHAEQFFTELVSEIHVIALIIFFEFLSYAGSEIVLFSHEAFSVV